RSAGAGRRHRAMAAAGRGVVQLAAGGGLASELARRGDAPMDLRALSAFHFLHPAWLLALPVLLAWVLWWRRSTGGDWTRVADPELLSLLRIGASRGSSSPWPLVGAAWTLAVLALAGPAWNRLQTPAFRAPPAWVLVLDL